MHITRYLNLLELLQKKSHFLFGPRQTGKTSLIRQTFGDVPIFDLLDADTFLRLAQRPTRLSEEIPREASIVVIDEIQKLPSLLDEVHRLIEGRNIHFLLTGSSARKLRHGGVNLLGGRARSRTLHPFVWEELKDHGFDLIRCLNWGLIPSIYFSEAPSEDLAAYVDDYLRMEIAAEGLTRNLPAFSRFLQVAACCNGQILNYSSIANDSQVPKTTVIEYFSILKETLLGHELPAWGESIKRKPIKTSKFYFFDLGVARHLQERRFPLKAKSPEFGEMFEAWLHHELRSYCDYHPGSVLHFWRSTTKLEVDFILNNSIAIEIKGKEIISRADLKGLYALHDEALIKSFYVVSLEKMRRQVDHVTILPWQEFLQLLWGHSL